MALSFGRSAVALLVMGALAACESPTKPPPAVNAVTIGPGVPIVESGGTLQLSAVTTASGGGVLEGRAISWTIDDSTVATVTATGLLTGLLNTGGVSRTTTVRATSEGKIGSAIVSVRPAEPASVILVPFAAPLTELESPTVEVVIRDAANNILTDRILAWESRDTTVATVTSAGQVQPKVFINSPNRDVRIVASTGELRDSIVVTVAPANLQAIVVSPAIPFLRDGWTKKLRVRVQTQSGAFIDGLAATYTSSNAAVASITSDGLLSAPDLASGTTDVIASYLGLADTVTVTVDNCGAAPGGSYPVELRIVGPALSPSVQQAFDCAVARIQAVIRTSPSTVTFGSGVTTGDGCLSQSVTGSTAGVIILVKVDIIDGPGLVLGSAGPCFVRNSSALTAIGVMRFDSDDIAGLESAGTLGAVIMHEMLHVIGIGTLWHETEFSHLYTGSNLSAGFLGSRAINACRVEHGGTDTCAARVPIETCLAISGCGAGTIFGHWREPVFVTELMTGYLTGLKPPLSRMTIEALGDFGYDVDPSQANEYVLPLPPLMASMAQPVPRGMKLPAPVMPTHRIDANGRTRRILR